MSEPVLEADGIHKFFRQGGAEIHVLRGASLVLRGGEIVGLAGRSGSGKSTLLSILGCLLAPSSGRLTIAGERAQRSDDLARLRRERLGFVYQNFNLLPALTALDNVALGPRLNGASISNARREAAQALDRVGLSDRRAFLPRELSGGEQQRVAIARAVVTSPTVILADEPTANLDAEVGGVVLARFAELVRESKRALLLVSHDPEALAFCDRIVELRGGILQPR